MKDALGHGSEKRGAAHQAGVDDISAEDIFARSIRQYNESEALAKSVLGQANPSAIFEKGDRKKVLSKSLDPRYELRVTDFDAAGPIGHREYHKADVRDITEEFNDARASGYTLRGKK